MNTLKASERQQSFFDSPKLGNVHLATIQSIIVMGISLMYYLNSNIQVSFQAIDPQIKIAVSLVVAAFCYYLAINLTNSKPQKWHLLLLGAGVVFMVFASNGHVHAQILDDVQGEIDTVGTAAGGNIAADILNAVISIIRIAFYIAIAGAVVASVIFGVTQGQWQAPVLVVGVIIAVGLFLELMGVAVFG